MFIFDTYSYDPGLCTKAIKENSTYEIYIYIYIYIYILIKVKINNNK